MIGKTLGHYEILEPLGAGGMGEVYRARDTKLERDVAITVLPEDSATDQHRLARFEREAKLLASLNHANIDVIYHRELQGVTSRRGAMDNPATVAAIAFSAGLMLSPGLAWPRSRCVDAADPGRPRRVRGPTPPAVRNR